MNGIGLHNVELIMAVTLVIVVLPLRSARCCCTSIIVCIGGFE
jgi:hypothetical protein